MSLNLEQFAGSNDFPVVDAGDYEVVLRITKKTTQDGSKEFANLDFFIRDDVEQKFQGAHVFDKAWKDAANPKWFDLKKLGGILVTQKGKDGYKTEFEEVDEFIQYINEVPLIVTVEKKYDDFAQKEVNSIKYLSYKPSKVGPYVKPVKNTATESAPTPLHADAKVELEAAPLQDVPVEVSPEMKDKLPF